MNMLQIEAFIRPSCMFSHLSQIINNLFLVFVDDEEGQGWPAEGGVEEKEKEELETGETVPPGGDHIAVEEELEGNDQGNYKGLQGED